MTSPQAITLRSKKLSVLLKDARLAAKKGVKECAALLDLPPDQYLAFERAAASPSLPALESLAYFLNVPLDHFWGRTALSETNGSDNIQNKLLLTIGLRQRIIGVLLRQARMDANLSLEALSERVDLTPARLNAFELGEQPIPLPVLEAVTHHLGRSIQEFFDTRGLVGQWRQEQQMIQHFLELPLHLQSFVSKPINQPFLEVAQRLSETSVEKLRAVAEGLLEITL